MKLLKEFKAQIGKIENLEKVWLTSFNINIEFIEKYILPAVLKREEIPSTRLDYEELQLELTESGIDFRVFCDKRFLGCAGNKRTALPVHGILPAAAQNRTKFPFSKNSIFHAKVIYLEGGNADPYIVGAGSANLTVDGWARNQEVFSFHEIDSKPLQNSVESFFKAIFSLYFPGQQLPLKKKYRLREESPISFCHSFQDTLFLDQFIDSHEHREIAVWSPYFPKDLAAYVDRLKSHIGISDMQISVVPDRVENQYLRTTWSDSISEKLSNQEIAFYSNPSPFGDKSSLCHAKVWKTKNKLAIGSWNFTSAGSNLPIVNKGESREHFNVEAGFIIKNTNPTNQILGNPLDVDASAFATEEQMQDEVLELPNTLPFDISVEFNWAELTYRFSGFWFLKPYDDGRYTIKLPGVKQPVSLVWEGKSKIRLKIPSLPVDTAEKILADHKYMILKESNAIGYGYIIETETHTRRTQQYSDLLGLMDGLIAGADDDPSAPISVNEDDSGEITVNGVPISNGDSESLPSANNEEISFFRLFTATYQFASKLHQVVDRKALEHWVFLRPGCLEELVNKANERIKTSPSPTIFNWFLANEVNELIKLAYKKRRQTNGYEKEISLCRWKSQLSITNPKLPCGTSAEYENLIKEQYKGLRKRWGKHD